MKKNEYIHEREREKEREMLSQHCHTAPLLLLLLLLLLCYKWYVFSKWNCSTLMFRIVTPTQWKRRAKLDLLRHFLTHLRYTHFPKEQRRECLFAAAPDHRRTNAKSPSSSWLLSFSSLFILLSRKSLRIKRNSWTNSIAWKHSRRRE